MTDTRPESTSVSNHYARLSTSYDRNWEYSERFMTWMTDELITRLKPLPGNVIADIGGGTGLYAVRILKRLDRQVSVLCIDPSPEMLASVPREDGLSTVEADATTAAEALAEIGIHSVDRILVKEAVHHFPDLDSDLAALSRLLTEGGQMTIAMLPPTIEYPLFRAAIDRFEALQPHYESVAKALRHVGLEVDISEASFPLQIPHVRYRSMVASRYMSVLSSFTDSELESGIREMDSAFPSDGVYRFRDTFVFVVAKHGR